MQSLINDLLSFSRHSVSPADFRRVDLKQLLKDVVSELEIQIEKSAAQIQIGELPVIIGVPGLLHQLFFNLLSNALKFRKTGVRPEAAFSLGNPKKLTMPYAPAIAIGTIFSFFGA